VLYFIRKKFTLFMPFDIVIYLHLCYFMLLGKNMCFSLKMVPGVRGSDVLDACNYRHHLITNIENPLCNFLISWKIVRKFREHEKLRL